jgi:hypothetical protein
LLLDAFGIRPPSPEKSYIFLIDMRNLRRVIWSFDFLELCGLLFQPLIRNFISGGHGKWKVSFYFWEELFTFYRIN